MVSLFKSRSCECNKYKASPCLYFKIFHTSQYVSKSFKSIQDISKYFKISQENFLGKLLITLWMCNG